MLPTAAIAGNARAAIWRALVQHSRHWPRRCLSAAVRLQSAASTTTNAHARAPPKHGIFVGTVAAPSSQEISIDEVIAHIEPAARGKPVQVSAAPSLLSLLSLLEAQAPLQSNTTKPGSLSFAIMHGDSCRIDAQLPLAQTIFTTGLPSTLLHTRFQFDPLSGQLRKQTSQRLESAHIRIPDSLAQGDKTLQAQLLPLTVPRRVISSMGNIVRKLASSESGLQTISASQELEAAVSNYFADRRKAPEAVQVWALIVPPEPGGPHAAEEPLSAALHNLDPASIRSLWACDGSRGLLGSSPHDDLLPTLVSGARLCKVLSGGGGWGKKAGLLSLDPDSQYSTRELRGDQGWNFTFDGDSLEEMLAAGRKQALGEVTREGESIVFFLATPSQWKEGPIADLVNDINYNGPGGIVLGALPASLDNEQAPENSCQVRHHGWSFGALSEGGLALTIAKDGAPVVQTKTDIPYARLNIGSNGQVN
ncbi:hypothetical protein BST61_g5381 [Cercospora zeina]